MPIAKPTIKPKTPLLEFPQEDAMFQAIGVLHADVELNEGKASVEIEGKHYPLGYTRSDGGEGISRFGRSPINRGVFRALAKAVDETGKRQKLVVYPRVIHLPDRDKPHQLSFNLLGFEGKRILENSVTKSLQHLEFSFSGLWQFIPVCQYPVITVQRNFSRERLELIKELEASDRVKCLKPSHVPIVWDKPLIKPFKFNPRLDKEQQGKPPFIQITARFSSSNDTFEFVALRNLPSENAPRFIKVAKADKTSLSHSPHMKLK